MSDQFTRLQTDVQNLTDGITALKAAVAAVETEIANLKAQNPDITPQLTALEAAIGDVTSITGTLNPPAPSPAPAGP